MATFAASHVPLPARRVLSAWGGGIILARPVVSTGRAKIPPLAADVHKALHEAGLQPASVAALRRLQVELLLRVATDSFASFHAAVKAPRPTQPVGMSSQPTPAIMLRHAPAVNPDELSFEHFVGQTLTIRRAS
jgi:hypothetical protein